VFNSRVKQRTFKSCESTNVAVPSVTVTICQYIKGAEFDTEHCSIIAVMLLLFPVCFGFFVHSNSHDSKCSIKRWQELKFATGVSCVL